MVVERSKSSCHTRRPGKWLCEVTSSLLRRDDLVRGRDTAHRIHPRADPERTETSGGREVALIERRDERGVEGARFLPEVHCHTLPLREAVEHPFERVLPADAALLEAAVRLAWKLSDSLIHLNPAGLDCVRCAQRLLEVVRPHVRGKAIVAVVGHAYGLDLV